MEELRGRLVSLLTRNVIDVQLTVHRDKLRIKQPTRYINIQHLFFHKTLHVSGIFCAHNQELSTVRTAIGTFHAVIL